MASYSRLRKPGPGNYGFNKYWAHSTKRVVRPAMEHDEDGELYDTGETESGYPHGYVSVDAKSPKFLTHYSNDNTNDHYGRISKETGLDPNFLMHLHSKAGYTSSGADEPTDERLYDALHSTPGSSTWNEDIEHIKNHPWANPDTLFTHVPGRLHVSEAFFDKDARHMFPTVLGIIKNDYPAHEVIPDSSLSKHSLKFSEHAKDMGLLDPKNLDYVEIEDNGLDFDSMLDDVPYPTGYRNPESVPESEVRAGRDFIRQAIRSNRPNKPHLSQQFDHPMLPGVE